jgi:hypothetical protein
MMLVLHAKIVGHQVPHELHLVEQFSIAYNTYLEIHKVVDLHVQKILGRDTSNWQSRNCCPPCMYKLRDLPQLLYSMLLTMDGNQSLRLVDYMFRSGSQHFDDRTINDPRWLTQEEVDVFKDEVSNTKANKTTVHVSVQMLRATFLQTSLSSYRLGMMRMWNKVQTRMGKKAESLHGCMELTMIVLERVWLAVLTNGTMQDLRHVRKCSRYSQPLGYFLQYATMAMF